MSDNSIHSGALLYSFTLALSCFRSAFSLWLDAGGHSMDGVPPCCTPMRSLSANYICIPAKKRVGWKTVSAVKVIAWNGIRSQPCLGMSQRRRLLKPTASTHWWGSSGSLTTNPKSLRDIRRCLNLSPYWSVKRQDKFLKNSHCEVFPQASRLHVCLLLVLLVKERFWSRNASWEITER